MKKRASPRLLRTAFSALLAGSLGFGASQAFASPKGASARLSCDPEACIELCEYELGFAYGRCRHGHCHCYDLELPSGKP